MKNTFILIGIYFLTLLTLQTNRIAAQSACCPDFYLSDAVEICPVESACVHDGSDPIGQFTPIMSACQETYHTYTVFPNDPTFSYTWSITGGIPNTTSGNPVSILWGTSNQGTITIFVNNLGVNGACVDTIVESICLVDGPQANFTLSTDTVCVNSPVIFNNISLGGSIYSWNFGDGNTSSLSNPPPHAYASPGTYTVVLTATDMGEGQWVISSNGQSETLVPCGCIDTISKVIVVIPGDGPTIETDCCYGTVCPGDTSYFCTSMTCSSFNWSVTGGSIISGSGTDCITVQWDNTYSVPTTVSLESCPGIGCQGTTTLNVPVLYPDLPIMGPSTLCVGSSGSFSLPTLPGTYYNWSVTGGTYSFNQADRNVTLVNITFNTLGTYWVKCEYDNPLSGCSGIDSVEVNVLPIFTIFGPETFCEGEITSLFATDAASWTISPSGPVIQSGNGTSSISVLWTPGNYTVTATAINPFAFCNLIATKNIEVIAKPVLNSIMGPDSICPGENYTFQVSSNTTNNLFVWTISSGIGDILSEMGSDKDSVVAQFNGPGPWTISVYQEIEISPGIFCQSLTENKTIYPYSAPTISGVVTVCVDAVETYIATGSTAPGNYEWTISPSSQGTIQSGQGTSSVDILWHGTPTTTILSVSNCSSTSSLSVVINGPANTVASYNMTPVFCLGGIQTLILSTPSGVGYSYQWFKDGIPVPGGILSNLPINIASFGLAGTYQYYVIVTVDGCPTQSNIINVVIEDCSIIGGGGTGQCDAVSFFRTYVVCDSITLINLSTVSPTATIISYQWNLSGPGIGTFSPSSTSVNPGLTVSSSGVYNVSLTVTSSTGCTDTWVESFSVLLPIASFTYTNPVCENEAATFNAIPNDPDYNYFWTFGDGSTSYDAITQHSYSVASPPPYTVSLLMTDEMGCIARDSVLITVDPAPNCVILASDTSFCPGDFVVLSTCAGMSNYNWFFNGNLIPSSSGNTYNGYEYGEYWVEVTNAFGCIGNTDSIFIYQNPLPIAEITGNGNVCTSSGGTPGFYLSTTFDANYSYSWSSNSIGVTFSPITGSNPYVSLTMPIALPVTYEFMVSITDLTTNCMAVDTFCVTFFESPSLSLPFLGDCEGSNIVLTPTPNDVTLYSYQWNNGATTPVITASAVGFYGLTITDLINGCTAPSSAGSIYPNPDLSLFPLGCRNICDSDSIQLYIPLPLNATWPNATYSTAYPIITWYDNGDYTMPIGTGEVINFPSTNTGSHQISVVVQNSFGCSDTSAVFCLDDVCCNILLESMISGKASCPEIADGWVTILLDSLSTGGPFTITSSPLISPLPTTITAGIPLYLTNIPVGVYVITISDPTGGCIMTYDFSIYAEQQYCCFAETDSLFTKILSDVTYTSDVVWDGKYYIDDNVTVTVTGGAVLDITVVDVVFGECAGIVFQNGSYLRSSNSVFRPCEIDGNWKGLRFDGPGNFDNTINESTFKNAEVALYFVNGSDAVISNNLFSNCNFGVRVETNNNFNHPISGNRFVTDQFFPDFSCLTKYSFVSNTGSYGIYSISSRFTYQVSHNQFIDSKHSLTPRTYGIYQTIGGGVYSENTFSDMYSSIWLQSQSFYTGIENNEFELNLQPNIWFPCIYVNSCQNSIIEINNNEISNNYNQFMSYSAIYTVSSNNISIVNNEIEGFRYGILSIFSKNFQISENYVKNSLTYGIYFFEQENSKSYITCNTIKMRNFLGTGFMSYNMK